MDIVKTEAPLRLSATLLLLLTACLVGFNTQKRDIFSTISKTATFRDLNALYVSVFIYSAAAAYNLLQLVRGLLFSRSKPEVNVSYRKLAWICFLLDQVTVYVVFAGNSAGLTASAMAVTGAPNLQWMKMCNRYTKFCLQIGGAVLCGYAASLTMALLSTLSAFTLFRLYSPKHFFGLKGKY